MSSTIIEPLAAALAALAETVQVTLSAGAQELKGYTWEPRDFDRVPAAAVGPPTLRRTGIEEGESQLGSDDWYMEFPVGLYFDLDEAAKSQGQMVDALEGYAAAIDADPSLGFATVLDCKLTRAEPFTEDGRNRTLIGYLCTVEVYRLVPNP